MNFLGSIIVLLRRKLHKLGLIYKIIAVFELPPPALFVRTMSRFGVKQILTIDSVLLGIFAYLTFVLIGIKNIFSFHQLNGETVFR